MNEFFLYCKRNIIKYGYFVCLVVAGLLQTIILCCCPWRYTCVGQTNSLFTTLKQVTVFWVKFKSWQDIKLVVLEQLVFFCLSGDGHVVTRTLSCLQEPRAGDAFAVVGAVRLRFSFECG